MHAIALLLSSFAVVGNGQEVQVANEDMQGTASELLMELLLARNYPGGNYGSSADRGRHSSTSDVEKWFNNELKWQGHASREELRALDSPLRKHFTVPVVSESQPTESPKPAGAKRYLRKARRAVEGPVGLAIQQIERRKRYAGTSDSGPKLKLLKASNRQVAAAGPVDVRYAPEKAKRAPAGPAGLARDKIADKSLTWDFSPPTFFSPPTDLLRDLRGGKTALLAKHKPMAYSYCQMVDAVEESEMRKVVFNALSLIHTLHVGGKLCKRGLPLTSGLNALLLALYAWMKYFMQFFKESQTLLKNLYSPGF